MTCCSSSCIAPTSTTTVNDMSVPSSSVAQESLTISGVTVTTSDLPAEGGFFLLFVSGLLWLIDVDYTVDWTTGVVTLVKAIPGGVTSVVVVYLKA